MNDRHWSESVFPGCLKISIVKPIYKKGNKDKIDNYRPITLTSVFSKIYEKVLMIQLIEFLDKHKVLVESQHGFRKSYSTITAGIEYFHEVLLRLEKGEKVTGLFLDLSKAFDSVSHEMLLTKIQDLGIRGVLHNIIKSFLSDRKQCTEISYKSRQFTTNKRSSFSLVKAGVPQGSVLGPLIFLLYVNNFPNTLNCKVISYADDTSLICWHNSRIGVEEVVKNAMTSIYAYLCKNNFTVNINKSKMMVFQHNSLNSCHLDTKITLTYFLLLDT